MVSSPSPFWASCFVLPTSATGPFPEVRVALGVPTTIIFDAALARDSVKLDGEGILQAGSQAVQINEPGRESGAMLESF